MRLQYRKIAPEAFSSFQPIHAYLQSCSIDAKLRALVELRISQINGCVYCVDKHCEEARRAGEQQQRLDCVAAWRECPFFDDRERAALAWTETVTHVSETGIPDGDFEVLREHFDEKEMIDLTIIVSMMNFWNRIAIGFRQAPAPRSE